MFETMGEVITHPDYNRMVIENVFLLIPQERKGERGK